MNMLSRTASILIVISFAAVAALVAGVRQAASPEALLGAGLRLEEVEFNLEGAIDTYKKVLADPKASHAVAAKAALQIGGCLEKLGRDPEAQPYYEQIVSRFADAGAVVAAARARLAAIQSGGAPALPFRERSLDASVRDAFFGETLFSPDGRFVAYYKSLSPDGPIMAALEKLTLHVRDLTSGTERKVLDDPNGDLTCWSPNSQYLAVPTGAAGWSAALSGDSTSVKGAALTVVPLMASKGRTVTVPTAGIVGLCGGAWSPDSRFFPYMGPTADPKVGEVKLLDVTTGTSRSLGVSASNDLLTLSQSITWAADGRRLAFAIRNAATKANEIHLVTLATGEQHAVPMPKALGANATLGRFTRAGLVINTKPPQPDAGMFLMSEDGSTLKKVCGREPNGDSCWDMSADGSSVIIWKSETKKLLLRNVATGADAPLTQGAGEENHGARSPDGRLATFTSNRDGRWAQYFVSLDRLPTPSPLRVIGFDSYPMRVEPAWTAAGVIFKMKYSDRNVVRLDVDARTGKAASQAQRLTIDAPLNYSPALSPDGKRIAYWFRKGSRSGVAVTDVDGTHERVVTERAPSALLGDLGQPGPGMRWRSADELLFDEWGGASRPDRALLALNVTTGAVRTVLSGIRAGNLWWSYLPGRDEVIYAAGNVLTAHPLGGGGDRVVAKASGDAESYLGLLVAAPDGRSIALIRRAAAANATIADFLAAPSDIVLLPLDGSPEKVLFTYRNLTMAAFPQTGPVAFSPDGKFLLIGGANGRPRVLNVATGENWALVDGPNAPAWNAEASWSADGSFIVLSVAESRTEWKMLEGLTSAGVAKLVAGRGRQ